MNPFIWYLLNSKQTILNIPYQNATSINLALRVVTGTTIPIDWGDGQITFNADNTFYTKTFGASTSGVLRIYNANNLLAIRSTTNNVWNFSLNLFNIAKSLITIIFRGNIIGNAINTSSFLEALSLIGTGSFNGLMSQMANTLRSITLSLTDTTFEYNIDTDSVAKTQLENIQLALNTKAIGDIANTPPLVNTLVLTGTGLLVSNHELTYTTKVWNSTMRQVVLRPKIGFGFTQLMSEQLIIDLANVTTWTNERLIDIRGNNGGIDITKPTLSSALATLGTKSVTVLYNSI